MATKAKLERQKAISEIVVSKKVETQQELVAELEKRGFDITQATVSRDIAELKLQRVRGEDNVSYYVLPERERQGGSEEHLRNVLRDFSRSVSVSKNLVVVRTSPGGAQPVASVLDSAGWEEILGTVAGDDTILVVAIDAKGGDTICKKLKGFMAGK